MLGLVNYQAVAAGTERVIRYFLGVGAAEGEPLPAGAGEALHKEDGAFLYRIGGAYQQDGMLTVPVSVLPERGAGRGRRATACWYTTPTGRRLRRVSSYYDDAKGEMSAPVFLTEGTTYHQPPGCPCRLDEPHLLGPGATRRAKPRSITWRCPTGRRALYLRRGGVLQRRLPSGLPAHVGGGVLALDTPRLWTPSPSAAPSGEGTVTALVGDDGHSVAFYGELSPALAARRRSLQQLWVPMLYSEDEAGRVQPVPAIWFIDEAGNRYRGCSIWHMPAAWVTDEAGNRYKRYRVFPGPAEGTGRSSGLLEEPEGEDYGYRGGGAGFQHSAHRPAAGGGDPVVYIHL